jgi:EpsI family protein
LGQISNRNIIIVVFILLLACVFIFRKPGPVASIKTNDLDEILERVDGWKAGVHIPYDTKIVESLALDDYVNKTFVKGDKAVSLYIGYYLTTSQVGAAHDPLVCFPGQGWDISGRDKGEIEVGDDAGSKVNYSTMVVERNGENRQVLLYWFQAYETTSADTFSQKISSMIKKITGAGEDNAFVRLTCATTEQSDAGCMESMQDFTKDFYPLFLDYVREKDNLPKNPQ